MYKSRPPHIERLGGDEKCRRRQRSTSGSESSCRKKRSHSKSRHPSESRGRGSVSSRPHDSNNFSHSHQKCTDDNSAKGISITRYGSAPNIIMRRRPGYSHPYTDPSSQSAISGTGDLKRQFSYSRNFVKETHAVEVNPVGEEVVRIRRPIQDKNEFVPDSKSVEMMKRMGWAPGCGLGKNNQGRRQALECLAAKSGNHGLGFAKCC